MDQINHLRSVLSGHDLTFLAEVPVVYHCHHYNLFHDQTIDDALGEEMSAQIRFRAARSSVGELLHKVGHALNLSTRTERADLCSALLPWMGHGRLLVQSTPQGGEATGTNLHYGFAWREKYGARIKRDFPADSFAAGFAAAACEYIEQLPPGSVEATEDRCLVLRDPDCHFQLKADSRSTPYSTIDRIAIERHVIPSFGGLEEARISAITEGLRNFVRGVAGDDRGVIAAFGVFVTMHLSNYYNGTIYEAIHHIEREQPALLPVAETLFREAGIQCVFNTFGNMLLSAEWEGLVGKPSGDPLEMLSSFCAIARGLGFGHWIVHEYDAGKRFVLRAPIDYEVPFYLEQYGKTDKPRCYVLQGAALAMTVLAHMVRWKDNPKLTPEFYLSLFRGKMPWTAEQTLCPTRGDTLCEVVVQTR